MAVHIPFSIALIIVLSVTVKNGNVHVLSGLLLRKKQKKQSSSQPSKQSSAESSSYKELRKLYDNLQKEHERVGTAFQNQQKQQEELEKELDEATKDAEELANLVRTKSEAIKALQNKLAQAKKTIAELKAENQTLRNNAPQTPQQQQQSGRVSTHSLAAIHDRYSHVLKIITENGCSMANAFRLASCPRIFVAVAKLKLVDAREHDLVIRDLQGGSDA